MKYIFNYFESHKSRNTLFYRTVIKGKETQLNLLGAMVMIALLIGSIHLIAELIAILIKQL